MTQKQLADRLGVTDKAVSKWERGKGQPDINYLQPLAEALNVSVSELLKGETENPASSADDNEDGDEAIVQKTLDYASSVYSTRSKSMPRIMMFAFLALGLAGIITTSIVDFALNGGFTWSLLPISAIVFSWLCVLPPLFFSKRGIDTMLLSISIFILPFLYIICKLTGRAWFVAVGIPMSISGLAMVWLIRAVFATRLSIWNKLALSVLIAAAGSIIIDFMLGKVLSDGGFDIWSLMAVAILVVVAILLFGIGRIRKSG